MPSVSRFSTRSIAAIAVAGGLAIAVVAGGSAKRTAALDRTDPESVTAAWYSSLYACGEQGAGLRYDLSTSPERDWTRSTYVRLEQRSGCQPGREPAVDTRLGERVGDTTVVLIVGRHITERFVLARGSDGTWKVDTSVTDEPGRAS